MGLRRYRYHDSAYTPHFLTIFQANCDERPDFHPATSGGDSKGIHMIRDDSGTLKTHPNKIYVLMSSVRSLTGLLHNCC